MSIVSKAYSHDKIIQMVHVNSEYINKRKGWEKKTYYQSQHSVQVFFFTATLLVFILWAIFSSK